MSSSSLIFGSLAGLNLRKGCSVALCSEHTRSLILIWSTLKRNQPSPGPMSVCSNWESFSFFYERRRARCNCWFSHDVTKIQITKLSIRLRFYFKDVFDRAAENTQIWWKHFSRYLVKEIYLWPKSWRGSLHIYLLLFSRVWTLSNWTVLFIYCNKKKTQNNTSKYQFTEIIM